MAARRECFGGEDDHFFCLLCHTKSAGCMPLPVQTWRTDPDYGNFERHAGLTCQCIAMFANFVER